MWSPSLDTIDALKHRAILNALRTDIGDGRLRLGDRLPAARVLATKLGVAVGTVARAYREAAADGLIQSEVGRGTHVLGNAPRRVAEPAFGARSNGLIDLSIDYPLQLLDPDPGPVLDRLARRTDRMELMRYVASEGSPRARVAGVAWAKRYDLAGRAIEAVVLCGGNQHALTVSLACVFGGRGGRIFSEALTYPGFKDATGLFGLQPEPIALDDQGMIPEALDEACREFPLDVPSAVYVVPSLQNPTTAAMSIKRREALARVIERHGLFVIEDDVHRLHADEPGAPIAALVPDKTFFIAGLSKVVSAGLRIAYLFPPRALVNATVRCVLATQWSVPPLMAEIAAEWIDDGTADAVREAKGKEAAERQRIAAELLKNSGTLRSQTQSFYLWLDLPEGWTGDSFALAAARRGIGVLSDSSFRISNDAGERRGARICVAAANSREELRTALTSIATVLEHPPGFSERIV
jgi:DNA-binding transcriptional MocR family regulator